MVFTCRIGRLVFDEGTSVIHAKLVRDTLLSQVLSPEPGSPRIDSSQKCYDFVKDHCGNVLAGVKFNIQLI